MFVLERRVLDGRLRNVGRHANRGISETVDEHGVHRAIRNHGRSGDVRATRRVDLGVRRCRIVALPRVLRVNVKVVLVEMTAVIIVCLHRVDVYDVGCDVRVLAVQKVLWWARVLGFGENQFVHIFEFLGNSVLVL